MRLELAVCPGCGQRRAIRYGGRVTTCVSPKREPKAPAG